MKNKLIKEAENIYQDCLYSAETHHMLANRGKRMAILFQLVPAVIAALSAGLVVGKAVPIWWGWLTVVSAIVTAVANVLNPLKEHYDHLLAAKSFTALKHEARLLYRTLAVSMIEKDLAEEVKSLVERYNTLARVAPPTDQKTFEKARERIQSGVHEPD